MNQLGVVTWQLQLIDQRTPPQQLLRWDLGHAGFMRFIFWCKTKANKGSFFAGAFPSYQMVQDLDRDAEYMLLRASTIFYTLNCKLGKPALWTKFSKSIRERVSTHKWPKCPACHCPALECPALASLELKQRNISNQTARPPCIIQE